MGRRSSAEARSPVMRCWTSVLVSDFAPMLSRTCQHWLVQGHFGLSDNSASTFGGAFVYVLSLAMRCRVWYVTWPNLLFQILSHFAHVWPREIMHEDFYSAVRR